MDPHSPSTIEALSERAAPVFRAHPEIAAVYLFGSTAEGRADDRSDLDFAVVCHRGTDRLACARLQVDLAGELNRVLRTDRIDVVVLNHCRSSELRFAAVEDGRVIYNAGVDLDEFEIRIRHEYFDHMATLRRLGLTRA